MQRRPIDTLLMIKSEELMKERLALFVLMEALREKQKMREEILQQIDEIEDQLLEERLNGILFSHLEKDRYLQILRSRLQQLDREIRMKEVVLEEKQGKTAMALQRKKAIEKLRVSRYTLKKNDLVCD